MKKTKTQVKMNGEGPQPVGYIDGYAGNSIDPGNIYAVVVFSDRIVSVPIRCLKPYYDKSSTGPR